MFQRQQKRLTLNNFSSNLEPGSDSGNGNLSYGFSRMVKEFWNLWHSNK